MKILIVEDNEDSLCLLETLLGKSGYEVVSAGNGVEAIEKLKKNTIDMIVSDILMPGMDGFEFCRKCKEDDSLKRIPFVFYTATYTDEKDEEFAMSLGAERFLVKPLEPDEFLEKINDVIRKYRKGAPLNPQVPIKKEKVYLAEYNKRLVEKLERKVLDMKREIVQRKQVEETLKESEEKYRLLVESANDAIFIADAETGIIIDANKRAEQMIGLPAEKIVGMHQASLHPQEEAEHYKRIFEDHINSGRAISKDIFVCNKDGKKIPVEISASITELKGKKIIQGIFRDITERRQTEQKLKDSEERMKLALEGTDEGIWDWDMIGGKITFCNNWARILGYEPGEMEFNFDWWNKSIHPNSKSVFEKSINDYFKGRKKYYELEYRIKSKSGDWRWIWARGKCMAYNTQGQPCRMIGTHRDITERKLAKELLQKQKKALEQKNIALSEVLGQIEIEKKQIKDNVIANAENLLLPVIQKLRLKGESRKYVQLLRKNLQELTSSFGARLTEKETRLTSREIELCNMIKNGLTSKEIAGLSNISRATIERHRANIRKKLGIINKDINLSSFLRTL